MNNSSTKAANTTVLVLWWAVLFNDYLYVRLISWCGYILRWAKGRHGSEGLNNFIDDLGPGQIVGRQVLGTSCLGEVQMGLSDKKGRLEVEIIRARGLVPKPGAKSVPGEQMS